MADVIGDLSPLFGVVIPIHNEAECLEAEWPSWWTRW